MTIGYEWQGDLAADEYVERYSGLRVGQRELERVLCGDKMQVLNLMADIYVRGRLAQKMKDEQPRPVNRNVLLLTQE